MNCSYFDDGRWAWGYWEEEASGSGESSRQCMNEATDAAESSLEIE